MLTRLSSVEEIQEAQDRLYDPERPVLVGMGPVEASTNMSMEQWPSIVYDTNLFYRDMGVHFRATRATIRRAYQDLGGEANVRLTMIAGVLLNPERRLAYDRVPLGRLFFDDEIEEALRIAAATQAGEIRAQGDEVDSQALNDAIEAMREAPDYMEEPAYAPRYPWSYYLYRMPIPTERTPDETERLDLWRAALISALWQIFPLDRPPTLAVGYFRSEPGEDDIRVAKVGFRVVCFMSDTLSFDLAEVLIAARLIVQVTNNTHTNTQGAIPWQAEASRQQSSPQQASLAPPSSV
jgi:hypothetical protein